MRCEEKLQIRNRKLALAVAARTSKREGYRLYVYKCLTCHHWHLSHHKWEKP